MSLQEIRENSYNLNITRYVITAKEEEPINLAEVHTEVITAEQKIQEAKVRHNSFFIELELPPFP